MSLTIDEKIKSVIEDYNDIAGEYCEEFGEKDNYNIYIEKWLKMMKGGEILDVGCGCAKNCQYINTFNGFHSIGIDFSESMLKEAKKRNPRCEVKKMDMTELEFNENSFDGIISNCSFIHIPTELAKKTLMGFKKVLKNDGNLLLILLEGKGELMVEEPYREGKDVYVYTKFYEKDEICNLLQETGFSINCIDFRKTESENELGGGELIIYAQNK